MLFALATMLEVSEQNGLRIVDDRAVTGQQPQRLERSHALQRRKVVGEVSLQIRRDIHRRPLHREVA